VGKVAVVTGGASGIGAAAVKRFAAEGSCVVIGDINNEKACELAHDLGDKVLPVQFDALDVASVEKMIALTVDHFGRLDFLFNNAALMSVKANVKDTGPVSINFEWCWVGRLPTVIWAKAWQSTCARTMSNSSLAKT
jgi:NAD(P)-dependent dehydrogenase (short-subunit alcohol dehydrogenase family)